MAKYAGLALGSACLVPPAAWVVAHGGWLGAFLVACADSGVVACLLLLAAHGWDAWAMAAVVEGFDLTDDPAELQAVFERGLDRYAATKPYQQALQRMFVVLAVATVVGWNLWRCL